MQDMIGALTVEAIASKMIGLEGSTDGIMWQSILTEWVSLILRWLHVVAAIAWIGSSF